MALLSRLFSTRKFNRNQNSLSCEKNERSSWKPFTFNKDQIRVLLFRECDWRGRKLLFDSQAVQKVVIEKACKLGFASRQKVDKSKKDAFVEITNGFGYQYTKPSADAPLIGEMMFGAVAMTFRGTAMKVHSMPNPNRLMCTKVFPSSEIRHCKRRSNLEDSLGSSLNSMSGSEAESCARDVPQSSAGDSGFCGDLSLRSVSSVGSWTPLNSPAGSRNSVGSMGQSGGSLSSLQRRWVRSMSTSLECGHGSAGECAATSSAHRRTRLGLCVIVTLTEEQRREMESFIFEHISVVETMVERLRLAVERAYVRKDMFVHVVHEGWQEMQQSFHDLFCLPRLVSPMWQCLGVNAANCPHSLANSFLQDLCQLIATLDTKATNFFVSTLVTGVLTHHLGWVNSVWPSSSPPTSTSSANDIPHSLSELSKSHPYNPLWAQLGDLYGALGSPGKAAKTVITSAGRKHDCVNKLLSVMSYFIRCGEVKEAVGLRYDGTETSPTISRRVRLGSSGKQLPETSTSDLRSTIGTSSQTLSDVSQIVFDQDNRRSKRCMSDRSLSSVETAVMAPSPRLTEFVSPLLTVCLSPEKRKAEPSPNADDVQKRLNVTMDILNREMERCKRERKGRGRNFCSPAGAEWEKEEFDGCTRESVERELPRLREGCCTNASDSFDEKSERLRNKDDLIESVDSTDGMCAKRLDNSLQSVGHKIDEALLKRENSSINSVKMELCNGFHKESKALEGHSKESDCFHQTGGLRSMKRSTSCRNQLGDLASGVGLYPNIEELAKMENIRLCDNYEEEPKTDLQLDQISTQVIAEKVNALCRVPTSAVSFHFDQQIQMFQAQDFEPQAAKRIDAEKQTAASDLRINLQPSHGTEVVFLLGDDEEPKGIRRRSTLSLNNHVTKTDSGIKTNSSSQEKVTEPKVVTVRSSFIDLEDERGNLKTECDGKSFLSPFETSVDVKSSISRSSSINFPIAKRNCIDKVAKVFRRHTEIYCDRCKQILKERRCAKSSDVSCEERREFFSCEKCYYSQSDHSGVDGQVGLRRSRSERVNAMDGLDDKNAVEESSLESEGQDHAMFEEYNPSDEEMTASVMRCERTKCDVDVKEFGFEDLRLVELQVPSCPVTDHRSVGLAGSLLGGSSPRYVPDLLLQGCVSPPIGWEAELRRDLQLAARSSALGSDVTEAVCLVADTQTWEVHLVSSHTYVVDRPGTLGVRVGMSQLVANMLESLALLCRLKTPPQHCLSHLESKMRELLLRSHALAELLLSTEFCSMRLLTSTLDLDPNDVPLLLAVASTHTPHISQRYGLSFV